MVWIRGHPSDYEDWGQIAGDAGAGKPCRAYKAIEDNEAGGDTYRGSGGPLFISSNKRFASLVDRFLAAAQAAGHKFNSDFNGANQEGVGIYQMTIKNGRCNSTARAFLKRAIKLKNLRVITRAHVTKVVLEINALSALNIRVIGSKNSIFKTRSGFGRWRHQYPSGADAVRNSRRTTSKTMELKLNMTTQMLAKT